MKKNKKLTRHYLRFILRPSRALQLSLFYFYGRITLFFAVRGIKLPGLEKIKKTIPESAFEAYRRRKLIYNIKGERYSFRKGPLWFRNFYDKIVYILSRNKFWLLITTKITLAILFITIPISLFIVIRGILPVPDRVPYEHIKTILSKNSNLKVYWPYTEAPFHSNKKKSTFNFIEYANNRGVLMTSVKDANAPINLAHFSVGSYPQKLFLLRGFLVGESSSIEIDRQHQIKKSFEEGNKLRIQYYLLPSKNKSTSQCQLQLKDEFENLIALTTKETPPEYKKRSSNALVRGWNERFIPNRTPDVGQVEEFIIHLPNPPKRITATVKNIDKKSQKTFPANEKNLTEDDCVYILGDFSFESVSKEPLKRRGIIFILVDTLRSQTAYDESVMPNLNNFAKKNALRFLEHRAQSNMTVPSVFSLMTSRYAQEIGPIAFTYGSEEKRKQSFYAKKYPLLATSMQNLGYRVGALGWLSLFSEALEGGVDLGFHNLIVSEHPEYETRQITELMGSWLERYGDAPFFLYVHYNTMHGPYKPPLENIDFKKFLSKPFGLNQRQELYKGVGRYWDNEFLNILGKLKELQLSEDVDLIITADHGAQLDVKPWNYFLGVDQNIQGGTADKGSSLFDEELQVPFIMKIAHHNSQYGKTIVDPTAHIDLYPTLYHLAGGKNPDREWQGLNLYSKHNQDSQYPLEQFSQQRDHIYFEGHQYAGILYWGGPFSKKPMKYVRQLIPGSVKLYLTHTPWRQKITWYQKEIYSSVNFSTHTETLLPTISNEQLRQLRTAYFTSSPAHKIIKFIPKYTGKFYLTFQIKTDKELTTERILLLPEKVKVTKILSKKNITFVFKGEVHTNEELSIDIAKSKIEKIHFPNPVSPILCSNGNKIGPQHLVHILENKICSFFPPPDEIIEMNYTENEKPILIQQTLSSEQGKQLDFTGAGEALKQALISWGYTN